MKNENVKEEIDMCKKLLKKFNESLEDCKKDYEFLKENKQTYGMTEEHKKAVETFKERTEGIQLTIKLLNQRLEELEENK